MSWQMQIVICYSKKGCQINVIAKNKLKILK